MKLTAPKTTSTRANVFGDSDDDSLAEVPPHLRHLKSRQSGGTIESSTNKPEEQEPADTYFYDEVFDNMKEAEKVVKRFNSGKAGSASSHMANLLDAKIRRELDKYELQNEKISRQRDREKEDELLKNKEIFTSASYQKFLEEAKQAQEEEQRRLTEGKRNYSGITNLARKVLDSEGKRHEIMMAASEGRLSAFVAKEEETSKEKKHREQDNPVLKGGLNFTAKPISKFKHLSQPHNRIPIPSNDVELIASKEKQPSNNDSERTLLEGRIDKLLRSKVTPEEVAAAKQRYLERKQNSRPLLS